MSACTIPASSDPSGVNAIPDMEVDSVTLNVSATGTNTIAVIATPSVGNRLHVRGMALGTSIDGTGITGAYGEIVQLHETNPVVEKVLFATVYEQAGDEAHAVGGINVALPVGKRVGLYVNVGAGSGFTFTNVATVFYTDEAP